MSKNFHAISHFTLKSPCSYIQPPALPEVTHIQDTALSVMVNFKYHTPPVISAHQSLEEAQVEMRIYYLPVLIVTDSERNIIGVVTSEDILGEKPVKISHEKRIPRSEIEVEMVMMPVRHSVFLEIEDLTHMRVGHIIQTFRETKQHVLLVVKTDPDTQVKKLSGLFSASLISRQLDKDLMQVLSEAQSIAELQHDLHY
jgi:CBS-domain-containing membrane protein